MKKYLTLKLFVLIGLIALSILSRFLPHAPNFSPIMAVALFSGAFFENKRSAFLIPLIALFISDLFIGFYPTMFFVYLCFAITVGIGIYIKKELSVGKVLFSSLLGSVLFFVITNFFHWLLMGMYSMDLQGLSQCYIAAIPFFRNSLTGDLFYTFVLFGGFSLAEKYVLNLKPIKI